MIVGRLEIQPAKWNVAQQAIIFLQPPVDIVIKNVFIFESIEQAYDFPFELYSNIFR